MQYLVVIEKAGRNYSAYVPDLPGCIATGRTPAATEKLLAEAVAFHLEGLKADGILPPKPTARTSRISIKLENTTRRPSAPRKTKRRAA